MSYLDPLQPNLFAPLALWQAPSTEAAVQGGADTPLPRFDLSDLYQSIEDPRILSDVERAVQLSATFERVFKGALREKLGLALSALAEIQSQIARPLIFLHLTLACNSADERSRQISSQVRERWATASANHLTFFEHEIGSTLTEPDLPELAKADRVIATHFGYLEQILKRAAHRLSPEVERALTIRAPFGPDEWRDYFDEMEVGLQFQIPHPLAPAHALSLAEALHLCYHHADGEVRFAALSCINSELSNRFAPIATRTLNAVLGAHGTESRERCYPHVMAERNLENMLSDSVVEALHEAVRTEGARQARRFYKLLAQHLGQTTLRWSDRTAKVMAVDRSVPWAEALSIVDAAWSAFSPRMADLARQFVAKRWVDVPPAPGKQSGAFNYSVVLPNPHGVRSYTLLNYQGTERDVMTLAHEFGHAVHGTLAGEAQGPLLYSAPLAYAETASIFGEMLVFEHLLTRDSLAGDPKRELSLIMDKCSDVVNTVVRQISFSVFEQRAHAARAKSKLTTKEFSTIWLSTTEEFYGPPGEVFTYESTDHLWTYVSHFLSPFYVYAYAFGELLTQTLFSLRKELAADFEPRYLALLKAGGSKDATELLKPFGLDPNDPAFWSQGIASSLGTWLDRAEDLSAIIGSKD